MEQDALGWLSQEDAARETYKYYMRTDPDMREFLGPIETKYDPVFGREVKQREGKVGMVRGQKPENMRDVTIFLEPLPHIRMEKGADLRGWYSNKSDGENPRMRERPCMTDAVLTTPYQGTCPVQCPFCYLDSGMRGYRATGLIAVPMGYGEHVRRQLSVMHVAQAGYFTSYHEPFNPLEATYHNTQAGATAFVDAGLPIFFLSRLSYPGWAFDLLTRNKYSYMQKSINTPDPADWAKLSPRAIPLAEHYVEIREARRRGIYVSIQCNPIIPGVTSHEDIEQLIERLADAGANHIIFKYVEANHPWVLAMIERLTKKFGDNRMAVFRELFIEKQAGAQTTIREDYRREGHRRALAKCRQVGVTMSLCYEYTKRDGKWRSMGPEFLTGEQCHGHRVPFHYRDGDRFRPFDVCPPSGCLSCADDNNGEARCGSKELGEARALKLSDYRRITPRLGEARTLD